jgi:hypothetical protein
MSATAPTAERNGGSAPDAEVFPIVTAANVGARDGCARTTDERLRAVLAYSSRRRTKRLTF